MLLDCSIEGRLGGCILLGSLCLHTNQYTTFHLLFYHYIPVRDIVLLCLLSPFSCIYSSSSLSPFVTVFHPDIDLVVCQLLPFPPLQKIYNNSVKTLSRYLPCPQQLQIEICSSIAPEDQDMVRVKLRTRTRTRITIMIKFRIRARTRPRVRIRIRTKRDHQSWGLIMKTSPPSGLPFNGHWCTMGTVVV